MMSSFRSAAAETVEKPMSFVEPSPPQTTTCVSPRPRWRSADLIPDASAAAEANGASETETPNALTGQAPVMIDQHEAGIDEDDLAVGCRGVQRAEEVAHVDRRAAAGTGGVAGEEERFLVDDVVEPGGHGYASTPR